MIFRMPKIFRPFFRALKNNQKIGNYRIWNFKSNKIKSVTDTGRGTWSEQDLIVDILDYGILPGAIFHDLYIKKSNGSFSQVDLVVATKVGLIVIEVKDYSGWIFGNGKQRQWTQVFRTTGKHKFYNPILQNVGHITELRKLSPQFRKIPMFSLIVFYGNCELKDVSFIPKNTFVAKAYRATDVIDSIIENNEPANYTNKLEIINLLKKSVKNGDMPDIETKHAENIKDMLGKDRVYK